jgi:hypothetical protein
MTQVIADLAATPPGRRNDALNHAAWTLGRRIVSGALEQADVEEALYAAAVANGLAADDGERQCGPRSGAGWAPACSSPKTSAPTTEHRGAGAAHEHHA